MLDRIEIEEAGPNPDKTAAEIHKQLGYISQPVNLEDLASALDITAVRYEALNNIEGVLVTTPSRSVGAILINANSRPSRQRFTFAHELGHFLNPWHKEPTEGGFWCVGKDISSAGVTISKSMNDFEKQEVEANRFASELLMPRRQIVRELTDEPDIEQIIAYAALYQVSKEAMARRYIELHFLKVAVIFSKAGRVRYFIKNQGIPFPSVKHGSPIDYSPGFGAGQNITSMVEVDISVWFDNPIQGQLFCQHHRQQNGYAITLLYLMQDDEDEEQLDTFDGMNSW